ncbi:predicted protein [Sclerotinia sclerotiorum 1980 UF-70]|uniref:Uncharacterized protein n=1 Tax=Sclerotinia sclerotiorum (strain ATCC 18683 / 1980 / Ss-1) TaxID=665079 RepID=A7F1M6_SCLS1|nr:predicted protein [Sclerotinia sclerotiorum 1980 UF-70]EDN95618.1 predicted protein [Sclerotinia sclerotiorum 1980 UF-70]
MLIVGGLEGFNTCFEVNVKIQGLTFNAPGITVTLVAVAVDDSA